MNIYIYALGFVYIYGDMARHLQIWVYTYIQSEQPDRAMCFSFVNDMYRCMRMHLRYDLGG